MGGGRYQQIVWAAGVLGVYLPSTCAPCSQLHVDLEAFRKDYAVFRKDYREELPAQGSVEFAITWQPNPTKAPSPNRRGNAM